MRENLPAVAARSIIPSGTSAVERTTDGKSAVDQSDWFGQLARTLLPDKPGTALHCITGYDERLCQRYAAGHVKPSAYFLRALLRSEQGEPFLHAVMDGCGAAWWIDYQKHRRMGRAADTAR